jgi:HK97 family phage prohead protease
MSELETRTIEFSDLETRNDNDGHHIVGLVAPFQSRYDTGRYIETLSSGVFDKSIKERGNRIPLLEQHDTQRHPIGMSVSWEKTATGLIADFKLAGTARGEEARTLAEEGIVTGLSVGFIPVRNRTGEINGKRHIERLEAKLDHVGLITTGRQAYQEAQVLSTRAYDPDDEELVPRLARWRHLLTNP